MSVYLHLGQYDCLDALILPFLDQEFQIVSRIPRQLVSDYSRFALIAFPRIVVAPACFLESKITRDSVLASPEFFGTDHVRLSLRETSLEAYLEKKRSAYIHWQNDFEGYYAGAEDLIGNLRLPIRQRTARIADSIELLWRKNAQSGDAFSFRHMTNVFSEKSIQKSVWQAVVSVPELLKGSPFIWQNVCSILDLHEPRWRTLPQFERALRSYLLKCYFESLCDPCDAIVAFSDFPDICVADRALFRPAIPLGPLRLFLMTSQLINPLRAMSAEQLLPIINSGACHDFRCRYMEILYKFRDDIADISAGRDQIREWSYHRGVQWCNSVKNWIGRALGMAGREARKRRSQWTLDALLDDAAARGFVGYVEATVETYRAELSALRAESENELLSGNIMVQLICMGDSYITQNAGIVGSNASGNIVNQSVDQRILDLSELAKELGQLRIAMKRVAIDPQHDVVIGQIAMAEIEAKAGNESKVLEYLKSAGRWAFDQATKIGVSTASAALKHALQI